MWCGMDIFFFSFLFEVTFSHTISGKATNRTSPALIIWCCPTRSHSIICWHLGRTFVSSHCDVPGYLREHTSTFRGFFISTQLIYLWMSCTCLNDTFQQLSAVKGFYASAYTYCVVQKREGSVACYMSIVYTFVFICVINICIQAGFETWTPMSQGVLANHLAIKTSTTVDAAD